MRQLVDCGNSSDTMRTLFQITNDMLHQNTGFVDDMIEQLIKQIDRMISRSAFRLADFVMRKAMFSTFITGDRQVDLHVSGIEYIIPEPDNKVKSFTPARDIAGNMARPTLGVRICDLTVC